MEGITILATNSVYMEPVLWTTLCIVYGALCSFAFIIFAIEAHSHSYVFVLIAVASLFLSFFGWKVAVKQTSVFSHYEYKVLIDDSVSLNEFNEKYEILDQEGQIYTVIERKVDE